MRAFFSFIVVLSAVMVLYVMSIFVRTAHNHYEDRYRALYGNPLARNYLPWVISQEAFASLPKEVAQPYQESVDDAETMGDVNWSLLLQSLVSCTALFVSGLVGLRATRTIRQL